MRGVCVPIQPVYVQADNPKKPDWLWGFAVTRLMTIGLAVALGILAGAALEASRSQSTTPALGLSSGVSTPDVSAAPAKSAKTVDVQFAADVEIEGERFRIFVGRNQRSGIPAPSVWSVAIPTNDAE